MVEAAGREQYFWPRENNFNIGQGGVQINVLLYPNIIHGQFKHSLWVSRLLL